MLACDASFICQPLCRAGVHMSRNPRRSSRVTVVAMDRSVTSRQRRTMSGFDARVSLVLALATQAFSLSQRILVDLADETAKYVFPKRFESRNLEEALMTVPDLETVKFNVLKRTDEYEIREVEPYFVAETTMPGKTGFDFSGSSQSFNILAEYLFGKNTVSEKMEMTTPVFTQKTQSGGEKMEMTTPVITRQRIKESGRCHFSCLQSMVPTCHYQKIPL
uniref:Heme-binding-like protein At3g10130, chloroplastic n=1 Tax=Nelumbo nucifera TaxID=4432 RepID=A0A822YCP7_NELNU|nr:TPA_asm: hypothetical protein HUJ06_030304 [Nelumbo nucifera]